MNEKVCNTEDLIKLCHQSAYHRLNRQVDATLVRGTADPEGTHLLAVVLPFHNGMRAKQGPHHRMNVFMKTKNSMEPTTFFLDVMENQYNLLREASDIKV